MAKAEHAHDTRNRQVPVESEIPGRTERDHQLTHFTIPHPSDERVIREDVHGGSNCLHCTHCGLRIALGKKFEQSLEIVQRDR